MQAADTNRLFNYPDPHPLLNLDGSTFTPISHPGSMTLWPPIDERLLSLASQLLVARFGQGMNFDSPTREADLCVSFARALIAKASEPVAPAMINANAFEQAESGA